jgi:hypothetical protein
MDHQPGAKPSLAEVIHEGSYRSITLSYPNGERRVLIGPAALAWMETEEAAEMVANGWHLAGNKLELRQSG